MTHSLLSDEKNKVSLVVKKKPNRLLSNKENNKGQNPSPLDEPPFS